MVLFWPALGRSARTRGALQVDNDLLRIVGSIRAYAEDTHRI